MRADIFDKGIFKAGDKVVPHSKTVPGYNSLEASSVWQCAIGRKQPYLWVVGVHDDPEKYLNRKQIDNNYIVLHLSENKNGSGDYYKDSDVVYYSGGAE